MYHLTLNIGAAGPPWIKSGDNQYIGTIGVALFDSVAYTIVQIQLHCTSIVTPTVVLIDPADSRNKPESTKFQKNRYAEVGERRY